MIGIRGFELGVHSKDPQDLLWRDGILGLFWRFGLGRWRGFDEVAWLVFPGRYHHHDVDSRLGSGVESYPRLALDSASCNLGF